MTIDQIPVWLDCDPGTDDAFAILLSLLHPKFNLLGISTVYGNTDIDNTTHNALALCDLLNKSVPVYRGVNHPLAKPPRYAAYCHGVSGMGDVKLPQHPRFKEATDKPYHEAIKDAILAHENEICLVVVGAYTNIHTVFSKYPELKSKIKLMSMMGGAFDFGNITPHAEFNVFADPKAANELITDPELMNKIIINGLNFTHSAVATKKIRDALFSKGTSIRKTFEDILNYYNRHHSEKYKDSEGPPIHDPLAVFTVLPFSSDPKDYGVEFVKRRVKVIESGEMEGATVFVNGSKLTDPGNEKEGCMVPYKINNELFYSYIGEALDIADSLASE